MKNIQILIAILLFVSCKNNDNKSTIFLKSNNNLLFLDKENNLYLKVLKSKIGTDSLTKVFYDKVGVNDTGVIKLKDIIDLNSFRLIENHCCFYKDKNYYYVFQEFPPTYPPFKKLNLNQTNVKIEEDYIFDDKNAYWLGIKLNNEKEVFKNFKVITLKDTLDNYYYLGNNNSNIYLNQNLLNIEELKRMPIEKTFKDSLVRKFNIK